VENTLIGDRYFIMNRFTQWYRVGACALLALLMTGESVFAALPSGFQSVVIASGFRNPNGQNTDAISLQQAPDGRIFTIQQGGRVSVVSTGGTRTTFHTVPTRQDGEDGLLGIVLHPNFSTNGWIYLYYTSTSGGLHNRIVRIQGATPTANVSTGQETLIYRLSDSAATIHNGGAMQFYQGKLYATSGDNSASGNAQNLDNSLGKVLRMNDDGTAPTDNPFYTTPSARRSYIWAYGFRNPYSMDINQSTGLIFVGNVGNYGRETIKNVTKGRNLGWPNGGAIDSLDGAVYNYPYSVGCALTSGAWFQPTGNTNWPSQYVGAYFYTDWCSDWVKYLRMNSSGTWYSTTFSGDGFNESIGWRMGVDGSMYYFRRDLGTLNKIVYGTNIAPTISVQPASGTYETGTTFSLSVSACCGALTYQWRKNGTAIAGATGPNYIDGAVTTADAGAYSVTITNSAGSVTSQNATITVIAPSSPPTASINAPLPGFQFTSGVPISFSGSGFDPETGNLPASAFKWLLEFHHQSAVPHVHPGPAFVFTDGKSGTFTLPTGDHLGDTSKEPIFYRLILTVTDPVGKTGTSHVDIYPDPVTVNITSTPVSGLNVTVDSTVYPTPFSQVGGKGNDFILGVVPTQTIGNKKYTFAGWSDGGAASHTFRLDTGPYNLVANFDETTVTVPTTTSEFEILTVAASSGDARYAIADPVTSAGKWLKFMANATGDFITLAVPNVSAGTYKIIVKAKGLNDRGIAQLATAEAAGGPFTNKDGPKDFYTTGATGTYNTVNFTNTVTFTTSGTKYFRFTVTGKNAGSTSYVLPLDALILTGQ
jgi:Glucose / Sorbosone dehydrogenase